MPKIHRSSVLVRVALGLLGATLGLQAALHLKKGEPDYFNFYRQPVSAHVALVLGIAAMDRRSAQLNWRNDVTSSTDMVNRGLKGP